MTQLHVAEISLVQDQRNSTSKRTIEETHTQFSFKIYKSSMLCVFCFDTKTHGLMHQHSPNSYRYQENLLLLLEVLLVLKGFFPT